MEKTRAVELDLAKGIGILLVIVGHIQYISEDLRNFIVAFHIPLFFVMAGVLLYIGKAEQKSLAKTFVKKTHSILQPYFIFSLIFLVAQYEAYRIGSSITLELVKQNIYLTVIFYGMSVLWFLAALFAGEIAFIAVRKMFHHKLTPLILFVWLIISCVLNRYLSQLCIYYGDRVWISYVMYFAQVLIRIGLVTFLIGAGFYGWHFYEKIRKHDWISLTAGILCLAATWFLSKKNGGVDLHFMVLGNELLYFMAALLGSAGIILISCGIRKAAAFPVLRLLQFYGKNSLIVMMTHVDTYLMYASTIVVMHFNKGMVNYNGNVKFCVEIFCLITGVEALVILIINRFFPWMVGKGERADGHHKKVQ